MDDDALRARHGASQRALYAAVTPATAGGRVLELAGGAVQAAITPAVPGVSLFNAVVYDEGAALLGARDELAAIYDGAGVQAWTVWVRPGDEVVAAGLRAAGHVHDGRPLLMGAELGVMDLDPRDGLELDLDPAPSFAVLADLNDAAYGAPAGTFAPAVAGLGDAGPRAWLARAGGRPVAALSVALHDGDAYVWLVATAPEARGRGLASELLRGALRAARDEAGATTTTLEATAMGEGVYRRLGYRDLGRLGMWEHRVPA
jgi:ribosomal protein S18 acetylase RimI-like enzyme